MGSAQRCVLVERMSGPGDTLYRLVSDRVPVVGIDAGLGETYFITYFILCRYVGQRAMNTWYCCSF